MSRNNILELENLSKDVSMSDTLTDFLRESAQKMLKVAIESEVDDFISSKGEKLSNGHNRVVRNGYLPERNIQTGIGNISVKVPRVRDRGNGDLVFTSSFIPPYMRRTVTMDVLLPLLYLKGISTNDFQVAFEPILGSNANNLSPQVISRLKEGWYEEFTTWQKRDLSKKNYVYFWVDGVYLQARMESDKNCILVIIGADENGKKELIAISDGVRESKQSWRELLLDLKDRGLQEYPKVAIGDGSLGFWGAVTEVFPKTKHQRCWVHKTMNILDKLPKSNRSKAKEMLQEIYSSENKDDACVAFNKFINKYEAKYPKVVECLIKDKDSLLTFYDFPAEHWIHLRTTNPIESTFSTVKHRTRKSKNCFSRKTILASVFKLFLEAEKRWIPLRGKKRIAEVIQLHKFVDGINQNELLIENQQIKYVA